MTDINSSIPSFINGEIKEEEVEESYEAAPLADMLVIKDEPKYAELINASSNENNSNADLYDNNMILSMKSEEENFVPDLNNFITNSIERLQESITVATSDMKSLHCILNGEDSKDMLGNSISNLSANDELYLMSDGMNIEQISLHTNSDDMCQGLTFDPLLLADATLSCSLCSFTTEKQETLQQHECNHRKANVLKCTYCNEKYPENTLSCHIQTVHPGKKIPFVSNYREKSEELQSHRVLISKPHIRKQFIHKKKRMSCTGCGFNFSFGYLKSHQNKCKAYLLKHSKTASSIKKKIKKKSSSLTEPPKSHNEQEEKYSSFKREPPKSHNEQEEKYSGFSCPKCSYVSTYSLGLKRHLKNHEKYEVLSCSGCGFKSIPHTLRYHQYKCKPFLLRKIKNLNEAPCENTTKSVSRNQPKISCPECSYKARVPSNLVQHQKSHEVFQNSFCAGCDFKSTPTTLRHHQYRCEAYLLKRIKDLEEEPITKNVSKAKPKNLKKNRNPNLNLFGYQKRGNQYGSCAGCGFTSIRRRLWHHQGRCEAYYLLQQSKDLDKKPSTNVIKKYSCPECSYKALRPCILKRHRQRSHLNFLVLSCPGCGFVTDLTNNLSHHQDTCNAYLLKRSKNFSCSECMYVSPMLGSFRRHLKNHRRFEILPCTGCGFRSSLNTLISHQKGCYAYFLKQSECPFESIDIKAESENPSTLSWSEPLLPQSTQEICLGLPASTPTVQII